jgi:hypothetical protein
MPLMRRRIAGNASCPLILLPSSITSRCLDHLMHNVNYMHCHLQHLTTVPLPHLWVSYGLRLNSHYVPCSLSDIDGIFIDHSASIDSVIRSVYMAQHLGRYPFSYSSQC